MASFGLTVAVTPAHVQLKPGGSTQVSVSITNVSDIVEHYQVGIVGLPSDDYWTSQPALTKLRPKDSGTVTVNIKLPAKGGILGGRYVLGVYVTSPYQPDVARSADLVLEVTAVQGMTLTATPMTAYGKRSASYALLLTNSGNIDVPVELVATDETGRATLQITPTSVHVRPGAAAAAQVTVTAPATLTGPERRSTIAVAAKADGETRGEVKLALVQPPLIPPALFRALGLVLAIAVMASAVLIGNTAGKKHAQTTTNPTPTTATSSPTGGEQSPSGGGGGSSVPVALELSPISVDPSTPLVNEDAVLSATATGQPEAWDWAIVGPDGEEKHFSDAEQLTHVFEQPGTSTITLTVTDAAEQRATQTLSIEVVDSPPAFAVATKAVQLEPGQAVTDAALCAEDLVVLGGGVTVASEEAPAPTLLQSSMGTGDGGDLTEWSVTVLGTGTTAVDATISATCAQRPAGYDVRTSSETVVEPAQSNETVLQCEDGLVALGGGGGIGSDDVPDNQSVLEESLPIIDADGRATAWMVRARNNSTAAQPLTAHIICAEEPDGYRVEPAQETVEAAVGYRMLPRASCPDGTTAISGGAGVTEESRDGSTLLQMEQSGPLPGDGTTSSDWTVGLSFTATVGQSVSTYAVCAKVLS